MTVDDTAVYGSQINNTTDVGPSNQGGNDPASSTGDTLTVKTIGTIGYTLSETSLSLPENAGTDSFTLVLDGKPNTNVVFHIATGDIAEGTLSITQITFTPENWNIPQSITVT